MSEETKSPEANDDRYVKICAYIKSVGHALREQIFSLVECNELEEAAEIVEHIAKLDRIYMLSLKTGMEIVEAKRKTEAPPETAASEAAAN